MDPLSKEKKKEKCINTRNTLRMVVSFMKLIHEEYEQCIYYAHHPQRPHNLGEKATHCIYERIWQYVHDLTPGLGSFACIKYKGRAGDVPQQWVQSQAEIK
jgi:hypothetical protein